MLNGVLIGWVSFLLLLANAQDATGKPPTGPVLGQWSSIFNGTSLDGWKFKIKGHPLGENPLETVQIEDGMIRMKYDNYEKFDGRFGHLFFETPASNYRFRCEYRFTGDQTKGGPGWAYRNSGIMLHCQDPASMRKDQDFPVCVEVQLLDGMGRPTGNLCTPGTNVEMNGRLHRQHCTNSKSQLFDGEEWVRAEVEVRGNGVIRHYINGKLVLEYQRPQLDPSDGDARRIIENQEGELMLDQGWIALQAESHPVDFRNIKMMLLAEENPVPEVPEK